MFNNNSNKNLKHNSKYFLKRTALWKQNSKIIDNKKLKNFKK